MFNFFYNLWFFPLQTLGSAYINGNLADPYVAATSG